MNYLRFKKDGKKFCYVSRREIWVVKVVDQDVVDYYQCVVNC